MIRLNKVNNPPSYISRHDSIVSGKRNADIKTQLETLRGKVSGRYKVFEDHMTQRTIEEIKEDSEMRSSKESLQSCYKNKTKNTIAIFTEIEKVQSKRVLERCPYCGITLPKTYDHYLPEENFPELSVHAVNLVPCCGECNSIKSNKWIKSGKRLFLHFYSDPIPTDQFLFVNLNTKPDSLAYGVKFTLSSKRPKNYAANDWELVKSHFKTLSLLKKYQDYSNNEISNVFTLCVAHIMDRGGSTENFLDYICDEEEKIFGPNHWRTVLKRELSLSVDFNHNVKNAALTPQI